MANHPTNEAAIPNPALQPLSVLVGEWTTVSTHPALPGTLHGSTTFKWIEGGAFLIMHSEVTEPGVPSGIAIFGSDDNAETFFMLYFDERSVSRKYQVTLQDHTLKIWRDAPEFPQRFTGTIATNGATISGFWEVIQDGSDWKRDLEITYARVS